MFNNQCSISRMVNNHFHRGGRNAPVIIDRQFCFPLFHDGDPPSFYFEANTSGNFNEAQNGIEIFELGNLS